MQTKIPSSYKAIPKKEHILFTYRIAKTQKTIDSLFCELKYKNSFGTDTSIKAHKHDITPNNNKRVYTQPVFTKLRVTTSQILHRPTNPFFS